MHAYIHTYVRTYVHAYMHTCIHAYTHTCIHAYMHAYIHTCIHAYMHTCTHAHMHTCIHAYMHIFIRDLLDFCQNLMFICRNWWVWLIFDPFSRRNKEMGPLSHGGRGDAHRQCRGVQVARLLGFFRWTTPWRHVLWGYPLVNIQIAIENGYRP